MPTAAKTSDDYVADVLLEVGGGNTNRLQQIMHDGCLRTEMLEALERVLPDPNVSTPAIERALEKWRNEDGTGSPLWPKKIGEAAIKTYRKNKYGL